MTSSELQQKNTAITLAWLIANLSQEHYQVVDRTQLATELDVSESTISRVLLVLTIHGQLLVSRGQGQAKASYQATPALIDLTPERVRELIVEYNTASSNRSKQKKASEYSLPLISMGPPPIEDTTITVNVTTIEKEENLTPAQQLLRQAQALVEAEKEALQQPTEYEFRLQAVERKLGVVLDLFRAASEVLFGTPESERVLDGKVTFEVASIESLPNALVAEGDTPTDPETTRAKLVQIVRAYGVQRNIKHRNVWTWLYQKLHEFYGFNAALHRQSEKELYLDVVERCNQIENLYAIAKRYLEPQTSTTA